MKQTRRLSISKRVFNSNDLIRIARIIDEQPAGENENVERTYSIRFANNSTIETDSSEVFQEDTLTTYGRPTSIQLSYLDYRRGRRISISLNHAYDFYGNEMIVSAKELPWLNANFQALEDAINRVQPQDSWVLRHQRLLLYLIALGLGTLVQGVADAVVIFVFKKLPILDELLPHPSPDSPWMKLLLSPSAQPFLFVAGWVWRWFVGFFFGSHSVHRWLLEMWPNIEFNFGLPHLQTEKIRRDRLVSVWVLIVLPIIASAIYDLIKEVLK